MTSEKDQLLADKDEEIAAKQEELKQKEKEIQALENEISESNEYLAEIESTVDEVSLGSSSTILGCLCLGTVWTPSLLRQDSYALIICFPAGWAPGNSRGIVLRDKQNPFKAPG